MAEVCVPIIVVCVHSNSYLSPYLLKKSWNVSSLVFWFLWNKNDEQWVSCFSLGSQSHGNAQVYKMTLILQLLVAGRRGAGAPAEQESALCPWRVINYWLGCLRKGLTSRCWEGAVPICEAPLQSCSGHTHLHCVRDKRGIQHWVPQVGGGSSTWGCTKDWLCNLRKSMLWENIIAAFNQL